MVLILIFFVEQILKMGAGDAYTSPQAPMCFLMQNKPFELESCLLSSSPVSPPFPLYPILSFLC